ncbi:MAG: BtpA/SgcQ family protein, partial [Planctomycetota bacterium]
LTQADMAADLEVSASYIALLERNHRPLSAEMLLRLAQTYKVDVAALAGGADFIRVNVHVGTAFTDQGWIEGRADETMRYRRAIGCRAAVFADVWVKHARPAGGGDIAAAAREVAYRGLADVLLVTGAETGVPPDPERLRAVRRAVPDRPVYVASGISPERVETFREADGFIVGTALKRSGRLGAPVDPARVRRLARAIRATR